MSQAHLGGHYGRTSMTLSTFDYIADKFNVKTVIDVGCGPAGMTVYGNYKNIYMLGIDGDTSIPPQDYIKFHDYTLGALELNETFDLAWSTEFLEHVYAAYIPNFMPSYQKAKYVFCTAAPPGQGGYHHVNEQPLEYWIKVFDDYGFDYVPEIMEDIRKTSNDRIVTTNSLFFKNRSTIETVERVAFPVDYETLKCEVNLYYDDLVQRFLHEGNGEVVSFDRW